MIPNDLAAIDEYRMRIRSTNGEDKARDRIGRWTGMRCVQIEYRDVGELAGTASGLLAIRSRARPGSCSMLPARASKMRLRPSAMPALASSGSTMLRIESSCAVAGDSAPSR